jgi:hypothetical protein
MKDGSDIPPFITIFGPNLNIKPTRAAEAGKYKIKAWIVDDSIGKTLINEFWIKVFYVVDSLTAEISNVTPAGEVNITFSQDMVTKNITEFNDNRDEIFEFYVTAILANGKTEIYFISDWEVVDMGTADLQIILDFDTAIKVKSKVNPTV